MGIKQPHTIEDGEGDQRIIRVDPFLIDPHAVTNAWFAEFVAETGYVTQAETFGWSFVFAGFVSPDQGTEAVATAPWWIKVHGATWRTPFGPGSSIDDSDNHPVVHVSWFDAASFAQWVGGRLPSEAEWVHAARGGRADARYPWGDDEPEDTAPFHCNIWQGSFPSGNTGADGYLATAPVNAFEPNGYGLYNMSGNVWEWCEDRFRVRSLSRIARQRDSDLRDNLNRVMKGGSYLCHKSYCYRYRVDARSGNTPDSSTGHTGLRIVWSR